MGSVGDCYDNAMCESFFATLECELIDQNSFRTRHEARSKVFFFIEGFYNRRCIHISIGGVAPIEAERRFTDGSSPLSNDTLTEPPWKLWRLFRLEEGEECRHQENHPLARSRSLFRLHLNAVIHPS